MEIKETVTKILSQRVDVDKLQPEAPLSSLGMDSLDLVEMSIEIEEAFNIEFTSEEIAALTTLQSMLDLIEKKLK